MEKFDDSTLLSRSNFVSRNKNFSAFIRLINGKLTEFTSRYHWPTNWRITNMSLLNMSLVLPAAHWLLLT